MTEEMAFVSLDELKNMTEIVADRAATSNLILTNPMGGLIGVITLGHGYMPLRSEATRLTREGYSLHGLGERPLFVFVDQLQERWSDVTAKLKSKNGVIIGIESTENTRCNLAVIPFIDGVENVLLSQFLRDNPLHTSPTSLSTDEVIAILFASQNLPT